MSPEHPDPLEEQFDALLVALDAALAAGEWPALDAAANVPPELYQRLRRAFDCLAILEQERLRARDGQAPPAAPDEIRQATDTPPPGT